MKNITNAWKRNYLNICTKNNNKNLFNLLNKFAIKIYHKKVGKIYENIKADFLHKLKYQFKILYYKSNCKIIPNN